MVVFFLKIPNLDFAVYLRPFYVPYMPHRYPAAKINKMPKGSVPALQQEMLRRVSKRYDDVDVIVRAANNDSLTILRAVDKESAHEFVQETLQEAWETADDWFIR
ncbi:TPA: DinI family protein [Escherichia coli]|uniref:DinI family protein n=9 Tax=Escherichia coli TaxID=562 RepID=A0A8T6QFZ7_ECOLX|nr:DinI-like family protein [Escherichia coli]EFK7990489.1 DinI family protein [Escherichia coli]EFN2460113.1 DinI family protein [Escherichia coli]EIG4384763.1 DinI-like family protein [Escherichia coli]EJS5118563.1 DinI-like family protein [Escherichia coli]MBA0999576.1 DinI-like family protein [Escherichia coli]